MNARQLFLPRPLRIIFKKGRRVRARVRGSWLTLKLKAGYPKWIAAYLAEQGLSGKVVVAKQGVLGVLTPQQYLRFTNTPKARKRLGQEMEGWTRLRAAGYADIIAGFMESRELADGLVVSAEPLSPISEENHLQIMLPLARRLVDAAAPRVPEKLPESISAGLTFAREVGVHLFGSPAAEQEFEAAFSRPLLTGYSHRDLHWRNVLHRKGQPVLIDLKKCQPDRLLCLDILNLACLSLAAVNGANVVTQAHEAHQRGWRDADLQPFLSLVDLPRSFWGPAYMLHVAGLYRLNRQSPSWSTDMLFRQVLQRDWRVA